MGWDDDDAVAMLFAETIPYPWAVRRENTIFHKLKLKKITLEKKHETKPIQKQFSGDEPNQSTGGFDRWARK